MQHMIIGMQCYCRLLASIKEGTITAHNYLVGSCDHNSGIIKVSHICIALVAFVAKLNFLLQLSLHTNHIKG